MEVGRDSKDQPKVHRTLGHLEVGETHPMQEKKSRKVAEDHNQSCLNKRQGPGQMVGQQRKETFNTESPGPDRLTGEKRRS